MQTLIKVDDETGELLEKWALLSGARSLLPLTQVTKWGNTYPAILYLILPLSALHLSFKRPEQRKEYL
jgi:hypothetical protein